MKHWIFACALLAALSIPITAQAGSNESHVWTNNESPDDYIWMTAIGYRDIGIAKIQKNIGAWCVRPKSHDERGFHADVTHVRAEIMRGSCSSPKHTDITLSFNTSQNRQTYILRKHIQHAGGNAFYNVYKFEHEY